MSKFPVLETEELYEGWVTPAVLQEEVVSTMKSLSSFKAPGRDTIPVELLEVGGDAESGWMQKLYNRAIQEGRVPGEWCTL